MKLEKTALYKLIEFDKGLLIVNAIDSMMDRPGTRELIISTPGGIAEYMQHFIHAKANGRNTSEAHEQAMRSSKLFEVTSRLKQ